MVAGTTTAPKPRNESPEDQTETKISVAAMVRKPLQETPEAKTGTRVARKARMVTTTTVNKALKVTPTTILAETRMAAIATMALKAHPRLATRPAPRVTPALNRNAFRLETLHLAADLVVVWQDS